MPSDIARLTLIVSGPGMNTIEIDYEPLPTSITIEVPAGDNRQFELLTYVMGESAFPAYRGTVTSDLVVGQPLSLHVVMVFVGGRFFVSNTGSNTVSVIDGVRNTVIATIPVGSGPRGIGVNPNTNRAYVANQNDNTVSVIDTESYTVTKTLSVGGAPWAIGVNPVTNKIYVANYGDSFVSVINGVTDTLITPVTITETEGIRIGVNPVTNKIYVVTEYTPSEGSVSVINGATDTEIVSLIVSLGAAGIIYPIGAGVVTSTNRIYVASSSDNAVAVIDGATDSWITGAGYPITCSGGDYNNDVAVNPNTNRLYVPSDGNDIVAVIDVTAEVEITGPGYPIAVGNEPFALAVNPVSNRIFVANWLGGNVSIIDGLTDQVIGSVAVGTNPSFVAVFP